MEYSKFWIIWGAPLVRACAPLNDEILPDAPAKYWLQPIGALSALSQSTHLTNIFHILFPATAAVSMFKVAAIALVPGATSIIKCCPVRTPQRARTPVCNAVRVGVFMEMESVAQVPVAPGPVIEAVMKSNLI